MPQWSVPLLSAVIAALLTAGGLGVVGFEDDGEGAARPPAAASSSTSPTPPTSAGTSPSTTSPILATTVTAPPSVEAVVPVLQRFVEKERGLAFKQPVSVTLLADGPFEKRLVDLDEQDAKELREASAVLQAMGLLDRGVDLAAVVQRFEAGSVVGFYDPETKELVLRGTSPTPFVRVVLVHELTHALEDQHFGLERNDLGDEAFLGFQALAEGSAIRIEDRYRATLSRSERRSVAREEARGEAPAGVPDVVQVLFGFPYAYGPSLVRAVVRAGGQSRLDQAFRDPPDSTEQVLDPSRYLRGDQPRSVPLPRADETAFDDGEIGQLFLALMLDAELDEDDAEEAAKGWGGDRYVAWRDGDRACVRMDFVMDTQGDTDELVAALARWAEKRSGTASASGPSLRTCG